MPVRDRKKKPQQLIAIEGSEIYYETSQRGNRLLHYMGHKYIKNNEHGKNVYWKCTKWHTGCKARAITSNESDQCALKSEHNHEALKEFYQ